MADDELLDRAKLAAGTGTRFAALFAGNLLNHPSQSEADFELCRMLLWWTGGDLERADALFRRSGLYRSKWDRHGYSNRTLSAALASLNGRYYVPGSSSCPPGAGCGSSRVLPFEQDRCVDKECSDSTSPESLIVRYIREIRRRTGRAVGLSVRQAGELIGKHFTNAAKILRKMFLDGELIAVSTGNYGNRLASEFDLPEFERVQVDPESPKSSNADPQTVRNAPVPYTFPPRKSGPFKPIWVWSSRYAAWQNLGIYDPAVIPTVYLEYLKRFRMAEWWIVGEQLIQRPKNGVRGTRSRPIPAVAAANK